MIRQTRLDSGTVVITDPVPGARSVALGAWVGVGSRDEPAGRAGVCHFLEHLLFKGTEHRTALQLARDVERSGGDLDAFTSREHTVVHGRFPARHRRIAVELLGEVLRAPALRASDVELEREVILEELAASLDVPEDEAWVALHEAQYPDHPLGRETLGTEATLRAIGRDDIAGFYAEAFGSERTVVTAAGDVDHDEVVHLVDEAFPAATSTVPLERSAPVHARGLRRELRRHCEQGQLLMAWSTIPAGDADRHALAVLAQVVGGGSASRLFQRIREERGLAYSVYASTASFTDAGSLVVSAATAPGRLPEVEELARAEVDDLRRGLDDDELATAAGFLMGSLELAAEDTTARMTGVALGALERGEPSDLDAEMAAVAAVTADDVVRVAERFLHDEPVVVAVRPLDG